MADLITENQKVYQQLALELTTKQIELLGVKFSRMNVDAVKNMIGFTSDGTKLSKLLLESYPLTIDKLKDTLIIAISKGQNPLKTARLMKDDMEGNLRRARTISRTEQLRVMRQTSIEAMKESKVVKGWKRFENIDCCVFCAEVNGRIYSFDEVFETHPNCRGSAIPYVD
jgi:SPP1 gp7 family putative phage head morphogenesis protein